MKEALVIVDMLNDFVDPDGALYVPDSEDTLNIVDQALVLVDFDIPVIYIGDAHEYGDPEFDVFPPHCVRGTWGAELVDGLTPDDSHDVMFEKQEISGFSNPQFEQYLHQEGVDRLIIAGVATEFCIKTLALEAIDRGFDVAVLVDGTAPFDTDDGNKALDDMDESGATIITFAAWEEEYLARIPFNDID